MINLLIDFWYIIIMPDSASEIFNWDLSFLRIYWTWFSGVSFFVGLIFIIWFYVFAKPILSLKKIFWIFVFGILPFILSLFNLFFMYKYRQALLAENWDGMVIFWIYIISYVAVVEINIILIVIATIINILWKKSATRRYPIKSIK